MFSNIIKKNFSALMLSWSFVLITTFFIYPVSAANLPTVQGSAGTYDVDSAQISFSPNPEDLKLQMVEYSYDNTQGWMVRSDLIDGWNNWTRVDDPNNQAFYDKINQEGWSYGGLYQVTSSALVRKDKQAGLEQLLYEMQNGSPDSAFNLTNGGQIFYSDIKANPSFYKITNGQIQVGSGGTVTPGGSSSSGGSSSGQGSSGGSGGTTVGGDPTKVLNDDSTAIKIGGITIPIPANLPKLFTNLKGAYTKILALIIGVSASVFIVMLLVGGYQYLTSAGNEEASSKAKKLLTNAIIGIIVVAISWGAGTWILAIVNLTK